MKIITRKEAKDQGLKRYFTGKPCKRGHVAERRMNGVCVECSRDNEKSRIEYHRQYYKENRDYKIEYKRQWREENPDYNRQWRDDNRDRRQEYMAQWREENIEHRLEYARRWYKDNRNYRIEYNKQRREEQRECERQYREDNRDRCRANHAKRRAGKLDRTLSHEEELTQFIMEEAAQQARDLEDAFGMPFHVDHAIPMQGTDVSGLHVWYNLQVIPARLNVAKGNRMLYTEDLEWLADATSE